MKSARSLPIVLLLAVSCAPSRFVEPLPEGHYAVTASLGGPLITFSGKVIPMPLTSFAFGYGFDSATTGFAALHTTALLFDDLQLELGGVHKLLDQDGLRPAISITPVANLALAMRDGSFKFWPELDANAYWHYCGSGNVVYAGISNWFELAGTRADGEPQTRHWIANLQLGHIFNSEHWQYITELKYLAVGVPNAPGVVDYHGIGSNGGFGVYFAITRKF